MSFFPSSSCYADSSEAWDVLRGIECCLKKFWQRKDELPTREELSSRFLLGHCSKGAWDWQEGRAGDKVLVIVLVKWLLPVTIRP